MAHAVSGNRAMAVAAWIIVPCRGVPFASDQRPRYQYTVSMVFIFIIFYLVCQQLIQIVNLGQTWEKDRINLMKSVLGTVYKGELAKGLYSWNCREYLYRGRVFRLCGFAKRGQEVL